MGGVYKKAYLNILNSFSIINLGMLSLLSIQYRSITITYVSASLAVAAMFGVLLYHVLLRLRGLYKKWRYKSVRFPRTSVEVSEDLETSELLPRLRDE